MDDFATSIRIARVEDAADVARVYVDSWHDTYPAILPSRLLRAMTLKGQSQRWKAAIVSNGPERVLVAESKRLGIVGMTSFGAAVDKIPGFDGEVYTLYVAPDHLGTGIGSGLLCAAFAALEGAGSRSCVIWAHAQNPARYFYERMGGQIVAERTRPLFGALVPESAFGWADLRRVGRRTSFRDNVNRS